MQKDHSRIKIAEKKSGIKISGIKKWWASGIKSGIKNSRIKISRIKKLLDQQNKNQWKKNWQSSRIKINGKKFGGDHQTYGTGDPQV